MAVVAISVKCLALFFLTAFLLVAVREGCDSDADCDRFFNGQLLWVALHPHNFSRSSFQ